MLINLYRPYVVAWGLTFMLRIYCFIGFFLVGFVACNTDKDHVNKSAEQFYPYIPSNLGKSVPFPKRNLFTKEGILLGRLLFYDPILSGSNTISCATCHKQNIAFSDQQILSNTGASGKNLLRHTPALINLAWNNSFFWDGGSNDLESQAFGPLQSHDEMNQDLSELLQELQKHSSYPSLFKSAFGSDSITTSNIVRAIAQFERTLISANSKYDKFVRNEPGGNLSEGELMGLSHFKQKCATCHTSEFFTDNNFHNNGLDASLNNKSHEQIYLGRYRITGREADIGKYKTPTLRNVELTAPYMHDGRFKSLEEVLNHYSSGVKLSASLDSTLQMNEMPGIRLSQIEKEQIVQFLKTLTDQEFVNSATFSDPLK